ncbi:Hypothetical predicted protein, partial [Paramuricea clavata]
FVKFLKFVKTKMTLRPITCFTLLILVIFCASETEFLRSCKNSGKCSSNGECCDRACISGGCVTPPPGRKRVV